MLLVIGLTSCDYARPVPLLERIKEKGELIVLTRNSATTYYEGPDGRPTGFEYELVKRFADRLGVKLKIIVPASFADIIPMTALGKAHIAAAGLTVTDDRKKHVLFGPRYQYITQQLVYRINNGHRPRSIDDLNGGLLEVMAGTSHVERLEELQQDFPDLYWNENTELENEELLTAVWQQDIDYTVADSNELAINQRYYPELRVGFDLTEQQPLAWAFPRLSDDSLYNEAVSFFGELIANGELDQLIERYYGHTVRFDYVGTRIFMRHMQSRLPKYQAHFEQAAADHDLDWRLLAALGYQESHWNPRAVSPTGVRGIMMLTLTTAKQVGVTSRLDPVQSIHGAAKYLRRLKGRISDRITEPDRTWMALAAYNVGKGHLDDARIITQQRGFDPDKWIYVKESLPLLRKKAWYKKTKHGYARGHEPVLYVRNIRNYYDLLVRLTEEALDEESLEPLLPEDPEEREQVMPQAI